MTLTPFTREQLLAIIEDVGEITDEDCKKWLKDGYGGPPPRRKGRELQLAAARAAIAVEDQAHVRAVKAMLNAWLARGDGVATYRNVDMSASQFGRRVHMSFGSTDAQIETPDPPETMPDTGLYGTPWAWKIEGIYKGRPL